MIEERGVATVAIGLVKPNIAQTQPPRGLWVPFPLGRPIGEPEDPAFQKRVMMAALSLLETATSPGTLVDFPDDAPSMTDTPGWAPQVVLPERATALPEDAAGWAAALNAEVARVMPAWEAARKRFGRTTVGNSGLAPDAWAAYAAQFLSGQIPESPIEGLSPAVVLRYVADDIKALYFEAAQAEGAQPSPAQVANWFWGTTLAADFLRALRLAAMESDHNGFKTVGSRFVVPVPFV